VLIRSVRPGHHKETDCEPRNPGANISLRARKTPKEIVTFLHREIPKIVTSLNTKERLRTLRFDTHAGEI
jgi:hypothetical protein